MGGKLFIQLGHGQQVDWVTTDPKGRPGGPIQRGTLEDTARQAAGHPLVVFLPGEEILLTRANPPTRNRRKLAEAIPNTLEEELAEDVEELHFALGRDPGDGHIPVAVIKREQMGLWLERLATADLQPRALIPETLCVPMDNPRTWSILVKERTTLVRTGAVAGFAIESGNTAYLVHSAWREAADSPPETIRIAYCGSGEGGIRPEQLAVTGVAVETVNGEASSLAQLVRGFNQQPGINLLQGPYTVGQSLSGQWRAWHRKNR